MKNLKLLVILISITVTNLCFSQSGWFWQNPLPQGNTLYDVELIGNGIAIACGETGTILRTTDNGNSWNIIKNDSGVVYKSVDFYNSNIGWIISTYNGKVIKTTNAGINWFELSLISGDGNNIEFTSLDTGYAAITSANSGFIFKTINSGENWNSVFSQSNSIVYSTFFLNNLTGYSYGTYGINKTTNGGINWNNNFSYGSPIKSINFLDINTGFATVTRYANPNIYFHVFKTTNGGTNWNEILLTTINSGNTYERISFLNSSTGFAYGTMLLKTTNEGSNWTGVTLNENLPYNSIDFSSPTSGLMVGYLGIILQTTSSGDSWINNFPSNRTGSGINSMRFYNKSIGFAVSGRKVMKTTNGGNNWNLSGDISSRTLYALSVIDSNIIYIAGGEQSFPSTAVVYKSTNGGINWVSQNPNIISGYGIVSMSFVNALTGYCLNWNGVSKTTNGGDNWLDIGAYGGFSIYFVNSNTGYLINDTYGYKTTNGGITWSSIPINGDDIYFVNTDIGYACGRYNKIQKTTNGGQTWIVQTQQSSSGGRFYSILFFNSIIGVAAGDDVARTTNGGINWYYQNPPTGNRFTDVCITDTNEYYLSGDYNTILKTTTGGNIIGLQTINLQVSKNFFLKQNYPNPFNPLTKIKFDVPKASFTKLIIYDVLGREVATLLNEELKPGTYEADWDGSNYSSGVFFYKIISGDFVETKKMILMK